VTVFRFARTQGRGASLLRHGVVVLLIPLLLQGCITWNVAVTADGQGIPIPWVRQDGPETCGSAALESVLRHWDVNTDQDALREKLGPPPRHGYHLNQLQTAAESYGLRTVLFRGTREDLQRLTELGRPCLIVVHSGPTRNHCLVVTAVDAMGLEVLDPAKGQIRFREWRALETTWNRLGSPILLVFRPETT
jgi:ABC-type bacteriocin/lantibiotic exporter with double-glycine peptidase domain